jgi:hypothetical protein
VRKAIAAAANTFPCALNRSMFFISRPPCGTRMLLALSDRIGPIIERWRVRIIPVRWLDLVRHFPCCWKRSIEYLRRATTNFPGDAMRVAIDDLLPLVICVALARFRLRICRWDTQRCGGFGAVYLLQSRPAASYLRSRGKSGALPTHREGQLS